MKSFRENTGGNLSDLEFAKNSLKGLKKIQTITVMYLMPLNCILKIS